MPSQSDIDRALTPVNLSGVFIGGHHHVVRNEEEAARWQRVVDAAREFLSEQRQSRVETAVAINNAAREQLARKFLDIISGQDSSQLPLEYHARTRAPVRRLVEVVIKAGFGD